MSQPTVQFITRMKLRELHRQRDLLRDAYGRIAVEADAGGTSPAQRMRRLYQGLRGVKFAGRPLHPEIVNLEPLLAEADTGGVSADVVALWQRRLEDELAAGRLRCEFVYLFGGLLEEWARDDVADPQAEQAQQERDRQVELTLTEPPPSRHVEVLGPLLDGLGPALADLARKFPGASAKVHGAISDPELTAVLERVAQDSYHAPRLRQEAAGFAARAEARRDLLDALNLLMAEADDWDWPADGFEAEAVWTRNKWRVYLREDLPTACLLALLGQRWAAQLNWLIADRSQLDRRRAKLNRLVAMNGPAAMIGKERRLLKDAELRAELGAMEPADPWADPADPAADELDSDSVAGQRAAAVRGLRRFPTRDVGANYEGINLAVRLSHAEVQLAREAFPDWPLYVLKADLRDFYPSIPHDVLLYLLRRLGMTAADLGFFTHFLRPPVRLGGEARGRAARGVPLVDHLSGLLAELLLRLLDRHVYQGAKVRMVRMVDDICILAPTADTIAAAWHRLQEFCAACGLAVNEEKCGAVCIGPGTLPPDLPRRLPRWGMLELTEAGDWRVNAETFDAHLAQARERVAAAPSVFSKVHQYNANARVLSLTLALAGNLGPAHRAGVASAIHRFHLEFFGPGRGVVAGLTGEVRRRFLQGGEATVIPESWVYWPMSAGGLGLHNPLIPLAQYAEGSRDLKRSERAEGPDAAGDEGGDEWAALFQAACAVITPATPAETQVMKTLTVDFIQRGRDISGGKQTDLSAYWRWVLTLYGPEILARFGTFRFLITELVPLQLISGRWVQETSLGTGGNGATGSHIEGGPDAADGENVPF
jgi:hypothetical protein